MVLGVMGTRAPSWSSVGISLCAGIIFFASVVDADARRRKSRSTYSPAYASIVLDAKSGRVLQATNADARRYPASITKVMTLYMMFEQLERGNLKLNTPIVFSRNASRQPPSKLGIRPGRSITARNAILALVTKSANDVAVAVAEHIGGSEPAFAAMMTAKARSLGMSRTNFANASGLPNPRQVTTARDLTKLGRAISAHYPRYYRYFRTRIFQFGNRRYRNHNKLLGRVRGVDGIKTGYTRASGFNLLTSVRHKNRYIVAVVLGGRSGGIRNRIMTRLVAKNLHRGSTRTSLAAIRKPTHARTRFAAKATPAPATRRAPVPAPRPAVKNTRLERILAKSAASQHAKPVQAAKPVARPTVVGTPVRLSAYTAHRRPAVVSGAVKSSDLIPTASIPGRGPAVIDGSTRSRAIRAGTGTTRAAVRTKTPSDLRWIRGPAPAVSRPVPPARIKHTARVRSAARVQAKPQATRKQAPRTIAQSAKSNRPAAARSGVMIQIGATDDLAKAKKLLTRARSKSRGMLASAKPFTETVRRNGSTLYRARFAGLTPRSAQSACRTLKRSGFGCFTTKN